jgi:hypothetical protein
MKAISLRTAALAAPLVGLVAIYGACAPDDPTTDNPSGGSAGTTSTSGTTSRQGCLHR